MSSDRIIRLHCINDGEGRRFDVVKAQVDCLAGLPSGGTLVYLRGSDMEFRVLEGVEELVGLLFAERVWLKLTNAEHPARYFYIAQDAIAGKVEREGGETYLIVGTDLPFRTATPFEEIELEGAVSWAN